MTTRRRKTGRSQSSEALFSLLGHRFQNPDLLTWALTHRSLAYETNPETLPNPGSDNEQLEFVGDAVLGLAVAESLFQRFPCSREGELTRLRASLVSRRHLGHVAARIGLGAWLRLGRGEEQSGGRQKPALLANALEAVIAALYLDGGLAVAQAFIEKHIIEPALPDLHFAMQAGDTFSGAIGDHKSPLHPTIHPPICPSARLKIGAGVCSRTPLLLLLFRIPWTAPLQASIIGERSNVRRMTTRLGCCTPFSP